MNTTIKKLVYYIDNEKGNIPIFVSLVTNEDVEHFTADTIDNRYENSISISISHHTNILREENKDLKKNTDIMVRLGLYKKVDIDMQNVLSESLNRNTQILTIKIKKHGL